MQHDYKQLLFSNPFQNGCCFQDIRDYWFAVMAPKISVTCDLNYNTIRIRSSISTVPLYWKVKSTFKRIFTLLSLNLKGQSLYLVSTKVFPFQIFFVLLVFSNPLLLSRWKDIFRGRSCNSLKRQISEKMKIGQCLDHESKQLLFNNPFQNICRFWR